MNNTFYPASSKLNIYPVLSQNILLIRSPKDCQLVFKKERIYINDVALKTLSLCDGTKSIYQIIQSVYGTEVVQKKEVHERLLSFFEDAAHRGYIQLYSTQRDEPVYIKIRGSYDYYFPQHVNIELTKMCNLKCKHCYLDDQTEKKSGYINTKKLFPVLESLSERGTVIVNLTGGEPTLHPDFLKILDFCAQRFSITAILTNGTLITDELAQKINSYGDKVAVSISLDGSTPEIHDTIRGVPGSFEKTIAAIKLLRKYNIRIALGMDVYPGNRKDIESTILLAQRLGAYHFSWATILPIGRGKNIEWTLTPGEWKEQIAYEINLRKKYENYLKNVTYQEMAKQTMEKGGNCGAGHMVCVMDPKGVVRPCLVISEEYIVLGNLFTQTPEEIFGSPLVRFLSHLQCPMHELSMCTSCQWSYYCHNCWGRAMKKAIDDHINCPWFEQSGIQNFLSTNH